MHDPDTQIPETVRLLLPHIIVSSQMATCTAQRLPKHPTALATAPNSACPPPMTLHSSRPNHVQTRFTRTHNAVYPTYQDIIVKSPTISQRRNQVSLPIQDPIRPEREYAHPALSAYYPVQTKRTSLCAQPLKESAMSHDQIHPPPMLSHPHTPTQISSHAHGQCSSIFLSLYRCAPYVQYIHF